MVTRARTLLDLEVVAGFGEIRWGDCAGSPRSGGTKYQKTRWMVHMLLRKSFVQSIAVLLIGR